MKYITYLSLQAKWFEPQLKDLLVNIVKDLNRFADVCARSQQITQHVAALGVDPNLFTLRVNKQLHRVSPLNQQGCFECSGDVCGAVIAPIKGGDRALAKALAYHKKDWIDTFPAGRWICDFLRATVYAQDPYIL